MKKPTETQVPGRKSVAALLETMAYHASELMTAPAEGDPGAGFRMTGCGLHAEDGFGVCLEIRIVPRTFGDDPVWDQVWINGESCGNRCGGRNRLAELYAPVVAHQAAIDAARVAAKQAA